MPDNEQVDKCIILRRDTFNLTEMDMNLLAIYTLDLSKINQKSK